MNPARRLKGHRSRSVVFLDQYWYWMHENQHRRGVVTPMTSISHFDFSFFSFSLFAGQYRLYMLILLLIVSAFAGDSFCPHDTCINEPYCAPRRCCGSVNLPVLGGIDLVDLYHCVDQNCTPQIGSSVFEHVPFGSRGRGYKFWFLNALNRDIFEADPKRYAPAAGGFCAFSMSTFDPNGIGLWCACNRHQDGVALIDGRLYFFLFDLAKRSFLKHGKDAIDHMNIEWTHLLQENNATETECYNTGRLVPSNDGSVVGPDPCQMMGCMQYMNCSDCKQ